MPVFARFKDFNFKLAVIQQLMYDQAFLLPRFDVYEFAKQYTARQIDIGKEGYAIISEVRQYFESFGIPMGALSAIEEIYQDGGDEIYMQLCPFWDGEDDMFNIQSAEDADLLPNLKVVTLFYHNNPRILREFRQRGIAATWL